MFYDKHDELAGFARQGLFGSNEGVTSINTLPAMYNGIATGPVDATTHPNVKSLLSLPMEHQKKHLQRISNITRHAFRINGVTYYKK